MAKPRPILPGSTYLITRRCSQRQFLLRPSALINQIFLYLLAVTAARFGIEVHAACALSNHYHAVVTDPHGRLPEFTALFHKLVAKCVNASLGRWENLWSSEEPSYVRLEGDEDILHWITYCLANPVSAGLVSHSDKWPGVCTRPGDITGDGIVVERPPVFFRQDGPMPAEATLQLSRPPGFEDHTDAELIALLQRSLDDRERKLRADFRKQRRRFLGARAVLAQSWTDTPETYARRRNLSPRIGARNRWRRLEAIRALRSFYDRYRAAFDQWRLGNRDVTFPHGTYALRRWANAPCASP